MRGAGFALVALLALSGCVSERVTLNADEQHLYEDFFYQYEFDKLPYEDQLLIKQYLAMFDDNEERGLARCEKSWNLTWSLAKRGYAKGYEDLMYMMGYGWANLPGRTSRSSHARSDMLLLIVHYLGKEEPPRDPQQRRNNYIEMLSEKPFSIATNPRFRECLLHGELTDCPRIAVEEKLVPSFEQFAAQIDAAGPEAVTAMCQDAVEKSSSRTQDYQ